MKPWREYRGPRAGEVESYLSRHCNRVTREKNKDGTTELRYAPSPCCGHDKRAASLVNATTGLWNCKACGKVGNWFTLTRAFGDPLPEGDRYKSGDLRIPWEAYGAMRAKTRRPVTMGHYPELLKYCQWRGFSPETLDAWRVTTKGENVLRWPIYAYNGTKWEIANARLRVAMPAARKDANVADWFEVKGGPTGLCIGNHLLGRKSNVVAVADWLQSDRSKPCPPDITTCTDKRVIITEGQWDAMTAWELGIGNVLSLPNGAAHMDAGMMLRYVPDDWDVWLCFDMDEAGERAVERAFAQLGSERVARIVMPAKDLNDWLMGEPELTAERVLGAAVGITRTMQAKAGLSVESPCGEEAAPPSRWIGFGETTAKAPRLICELPWAGLTKILSGGLKAEKTTGMLAPSGRGKTTIANQIGVHAASKGVKVGIISLEEARGDIADKLVRQAAGWTGKSDDELDAIMRNIMLSPLEGNRTTWRDCGREFETMIGEGAELLIFDNLDFIMPRESATDANSEKVQALGTCVELVKKSKTHMITVWQPKKIDPTKIVNSSDQKGFAQAFQDADNYLNVNWFGTLRRIEVEKHREKGIETGQNHVWVVYDRDIGCMIEVPATQAEAIRNDFGLKDPGSII